MRAAWGTKYGISATIPSSYWYLRWFDLKGMERNLDWFNFMSYDIHGVWDSTDKFSGPYIRPHTNLTEIELGLDLLWRNYVSPGSVTLGLGWYGRSFTLSNPNCHTPNGVCQFSGGGIPGMCTNSSGTLSNAEILQILDDTGAIAQFDQEAGVKWINWDEDQWVSYDDGETMQLKVNTANRLCLGGIMIWSVDQDDTYGSSTSDLLGLGKANKVSSKYALQSERNLMQARSDAVNMNSCYWSKCGGDCESGYFHQTGASGQVNGVSSDTECDHQIRKLCCAVGTQMGDCRWTGWRGIPFPCTGDICESFSGVAIAFNGMDIIIHIPAAN
jgi:GH18 family chitinase